MKYHWLAFFLLFFFGAFGIFSLPYDIIPVGESVLEDLRFLSLESGKSFLSFTPPLAPAEVEQFLNSIDSSLLSTPALEAFNRTTKRLTPEAALSFSSDNFTVLFGINSTLEGKARFNNDIAWHPQYPKVSPLLSFPIRFYFADNLQLYIEPIVANYFGRNSSGTFDINIPDEYLCLDVNLAHRAFMAAGGSWWNFQIGRDRLFWGTGHTGSLSFSDNSPFFEFFRLSFFSKIFKYSLIINQLPLEITDNLFINNTLPPGLDRDNHLMKTTQRYFYLHRIDFALFDNLSLGLMEGVMIGNSGPEIRYLNPVVIFHSLFSWNDYPNWYKDPNDERRHMNGSFFSFELNWNIIKTLAVYGQFVMNELSLPMEIEDNPYPPPNAFGFMAGLQYTHSFDTWHSVFFLEFIYTYPYLYVLSTPFASFIQAQKFSASEHHYYFIGYPRDTMAITFGTTFFKRDTLDLSGNFSWISRGQHDIKWDWKTGIAEEKGSYYETTPTGIAENKLIASLSAQWKLLPFLTFNGSITGILALNNNHIQGSNETGGQLAFSVSFRY
jgi:hypothetical protein